MKENEYHELIESLRKLYREKKFEDLRKKYVMCSWILTPEDRKKIESVLDKKFRAHTKKEQTIIDLAINMGGKIVDEII
jgi:hypothetical protein